jgi:hypothetical protein
MKRTCLLAVVSLVVSTVALAGCTLGEAVLPNPPPASQAVSLEIGSVVPVPDPIPHSLEGREACFTCHATGAVDATPVPDDHEQDVEECTICHAVWTQPGIATAAPPAMLHQLEGREGCLTCHKLGTAGAQRVPENHLGLPGDICRSCHVTGEEVTGGSVEAVGLASPIPHGLEGFATCTLCHEQGGGGVPQFPPDHAGRTDDICSACHSPLDAAPEPTATAAIAPTPGDLGGTSSSPAMPHALQGFAACTLCHEQGSATVPRFPVDHAGRSDDSCVACHAPAPSG